MSEHPPLVSAIVPVFNKGPYLAEAIASLDAQNIPEMEIVVVDDGSTDDSGLIVDQMPRLFPHLTIRCFHKPNGGASDARNFAVSRARGSIMVNMDADDIMRPNFLVQALPLVHSEGADVVYSDLELFGDRTGEWVPQPYDPYYIRYDNCVPSLAVYKRELWERVGGYNVSLPFNEDWNFFVALSSKGAQFRKLSGKYFAYRQTGTGLYHSFIREAWEWGSPMIMTTQSELFQVDEVLWACKKLMTMPERWARKFHTQHERHPQEWLLKFWLGLQREASGDTRGAIEHYQAAANASQCNQWLPLFRLAELVEPLDKTVSIQAYHRVRILRPDMGRVVNERIDALGKAQMPAPTV